MDCSMWCANSDTAGFPVVRVVSAAWLSTYIRILAVSQSFESTWRSPSWIVWSSASYTSALSPIQQYPEAISWEMWFPIFWYIVHPEPNIWLVDLEPSEYNRIKLGAKCRWNCSWLSGPSVGSFNFAIVIEKDVALVVCPHKCVFSNVSSAFKNWVTRESRCRN